GVVADEAYRTMHVVEDFRDGELRLRTVDDGEDGVAALQERVIHLGTNGSGVRAPAAANDHDHAQAVRFLLRREDVHRQGQSRLTAVNHVRSTFEGWSVLRPDGAGDREEKQTGEKRELQHFAHDDPRNNRGVGTPADVFRVTAKRAACNG